MSRPAGRRRAHVLIMRYKEQYRMMTCDGGEDGCDG